jgi:DNA-binding Lrp family transcriptional regulator
VQRPDDTPKRQTPQQWGRYRVTPEIARLPGTVLKVTLALAEYASPLQPWCWPRVATIAERLGIGQAKVRAWLEKAEAAGIIRKCRRRYPHASLGYDMRPWFAAMGYPEAATAEPPAKARIVSALGNSAVYRASKLSSVARKETQRGSALANSAVSSEPTREPTTRSQPVQNGRRLAVSTASTANGHRNGLLVGTDSPELAEARFLCEGLGVSASDFSRAVAQRPDLRPAEVLACCEKLARRHPEGRGLRNPAAMLAKWLAAEEPRGENRPASAATLSYQRALYGGMTREAEEEMRERLAATQKMLHPEVTE